MKLAFLAATAAALITLTPLANAGLVTWDYKGHLTSADVATNYHAGDSFEAIVTFDPAATDLSPTSTLRHSLDVSALKISYQIGTTGWQLLDSSFGGLTYLRDNQQVQNVGPFVDGLSFVLGDVALILRWYDLNTINYGNHLVPSIPPTLTNLEANSFQNGDVFQGTIDSVSAVPEPESYALMLAGLGLIGAVARRRTAKPA